MDVNRPSLAIGALSLGLLGTLLPTLALSHQLTLPNGKGGPNTQIPLGGNRGFVPGASQGWSNSTMSAMTLAQQTDQAISYLTKVYCNADMRWQASDGGHGGSVLETAIQDSKTFLIDYPTLLVQKGPKGSLGPVLLGTKLIANGKRMATWRSGKGILSDQPLAQAQFDWHVGPGRWPFDFPRAMFSAIRGGHPFEYLVKVVSQPGSGYSITVKERKFEFRGHIFNQKQLTVSKRGHSDKPVFQATIDGTQRLPVTIVANANATDKIAEQVSWRAKWSRVPSFDSKLFAIPDVTKVIGG